MTPVGGGQTAGTNPRGWAEKGREANPDPRRSVLEEEREGQGEPPGRELQLAIGFDAAHSRCS
jgi:hypothetical protein